MRGPRGVLGKLPKLAPVCRATRGSRVSLPRLPCRSRRMPLREGALATGPGSVRRIERAVLTSLVTSLEAMAGTAQILRGKPSQTQSRRGFKIGIKERDLIDWSPRGNYSRARSRETPEI